MKRIVIYYSFEGNTKLIAETIAEKLKAEVLRLTPVQEMESSGFSKYIWGGAKVVMKKKPKLADLEIDPQEYDEIYIGTPVWAWTYSPAIRTFFEENYITGKKVHFFCTHEGGLGKTILKAMKLINEKNVFVDSIDFLNVKRDTDNQINKAINWVK